MCVHACAYVCVRVCACVYACVRALNSLYLRNEPTDFRRVKLILFVIYTWHNNYLNNSKYQVGGGCEFHMYPGARQPFIQPAKQLFK